MNKLLAKRVKKLADPTVINTLKHASRPDIISLGGGIPNPDLFPKKQIKQVIAEIMENELETIMQYSVTAGINILREEIAKYFSKKWNKKITAENILITSGSQQGIDLLGKTFLDDSKDKIVVENPTYFVAISAFNTYNPKYLTLETKNGQPNLDDLEMFLEKNNNIKFIYAVPTFQNPTGGTWNLHARKKVLEIIKKHNILFLEDDPYGEIYFNKKPPKSVTALDKSGLSIYLGTFSKTLTPGLRVGFIIANKELIKTLTLIKQSMDLHSPVFSQLIIAKLLAKKDFYENHLKKLRTYYKENAKYLTQQIDKKLNDYVEYNKPSGGLFIWLNLKNTNCEDLLKKSLKEKIAFMPGYPFYANEKNPCTLRLTFSTATKSQMKIAIERLQTCLKK